MNNIDIKKIRLKLNLSQKKLANMIGVTEKTVQNWEYGKTIPKSKNVILRSLLLDPQWLISGNGEMLKNDISVESQKLENATITMPAEIWAVIKQQAASLESKDKQLENKDKQIEKMITLLEKQINENKKTVVQEGDNATCVVAG